MHISINGSGSESGKEMSNEMPAITPREGDYESITFDIETVTLISTNNNIKQKCRASSNY